VKSLGAMAGAAALGAVVAGGAMIALRPAAAPDAVRTYLLAHPEVIPEAMQRLQDKQNAGLVAANATQIRTPFAGAVAGNPKGDVTVTEFYDYACTYCRAAVADVDRLVKSDPQVRVVFKEMPVISPLSDQAARVSLAAAKAGNFAAFHHALYAAGTLDETTLADAARKAGVDQAAAEAPDIGREVDASLDVVRALKLSGTPTFIIGDRILPGAIGYDRLKEAVADARANPGKA
jgi:protein-disulfide isomerase